MGPEDGGDDTGEVADVTSEGRRLPAPGVVMKAEPILPAGEWLETDDGCLIDIDVEEAARGPDGDVIVTAVTTDRRDQRVGVIGQAGRVSDGAFRRHAGLLRAPDARYLRLERIPGEAPRKRVRAMRVPHVDEAEQRRAQLGDRVEVAMA